MLGLIGGYQWWASGADVAAWPLDVLPGNVEVRQVDLGLQVPGRIQRLAVDEGDSVTAGSQSRCKAGLLASAHIGKVLSGE